MRRGWFVVVLCYVIAVSACGGTDTGDSATTQPASTETVAGTGTTVVPATTPPATSSSVVTATTLETVALPEPGETWDLLVLADRYDLGEDVPLMYAERAEEALGVEVEAHNPGGIEPFARYILGSLRDERYPSLADLARRAEIIVLSTMPERSSENPTGIDADSENCSFFAMGSDPKPPPPTTAEYWQPYSDLLDEIYTEIWALRNGAPTVMITIDLPNRYVNKQQEVGIEPECRAWVEAWSNIVREAAADHGSTMVSLYDLFNGPSHELDAGELGYIGPTEQQPTLAFYTPNEVGTEMIVNALAAAGFNQATQP